MWLLKFINSMRHACSDPLTSVGPELSTRVTSVTFTLSLPVTETKRLALPPESYDKRERDTRRVYSMCDSFLDVKNMYLT